MMQKPTTAPVRPRWGLHLPELHRPGGGDRARAPRRTSDASWLHSLQPMGNGPGLHPLYMGNSGVQARRRSQRNLSLCHDA
jgi:hypothetical protein